MKNTELMNTAKLKKILKTLDIDFDNFNDLQKQQIILGLQNGLDIQQIKQYANEKLSDSQMELIRHAMEMGLSSEKISIFNNPDYSFGLMLYAKVDLLNDISEEFVKYYLNLYLNNKFNIAKIQHIRDFYIVENMKLEEIKLAVELYNWISQNIQTDFSKAQFSLHKVLKNFLMFKEHGMDILLRKDNIMSFFQKHLNENNLSEFSILSKRFLDSCKLEKLFTKNIVPSDQNDVSNNLTMNVFKL